MNKILSICFAITLAFEINAQSQRAYLEGLQYNLDDIQNFTSYAKENLSYITAEQAGENFGKDSLYLTQLFAKMDSLVMLAKSRTEAIIIAEEVKDSRYIGDENMQAEPDTTDPYAEREYKSDFENKDEEDVFGNPMVDQINPLKKKKTKFVIETGVNNFKLEGIGDFIAIPEVATGKSWFWSYSLLKQVSRSKTLSIETGITYMRNRFSFDNDVALLRANDELPYTFQKVNNATKNPCLRVYYLQVPVNFKINLNRMIHATIGVYGGYRVATSQKLESKSGTEEVREERYDSYGLNNWVYGGKFGLGVKSLDIFVNYNLSNLFKSKIPYEANAFMIGTSFRI